MMSAATHSPVATLAPVSINLSGQAPSIDVLRRFIESEADLLDRGDFDAWCDLFAEDAIYWVPAQRGQVSWTSHVSLFYDDKHTMRTRVQRLNHSMMHCQEPASQCVRVLSGTKLEAISNDGTLYSTQTKFIMFEDRPRKPQRIFAGTCKHQLRWNGERIEIVLKRVDLTNCDQSFPSLSQPF